MELLCLLTLGKLLKGKCLAFGWYWESPGKGKQEEPAEAPHLQAVEAVDSETTLHLYEDWSRVPGSAGLRPKGQGGPANERRIMWTPVLLKCGIYILLNESHATLNMSEGVWLLDTSIGVSSCLLEDWPEQSLCSDDIDFGWPLNIQFSSREGSSVLTAWDSELSTEGKIWNTKINIFSFTVEMRKFWNRWPLRTHGCTWVRNIGEGLGLIGSTRISHDKDAHWNWGSDWLVVKWRDHHYQMILGRQTNKRKITNQWRKYF